MADQHCNEGSSTSNFPGEGSDATVELNVKTLDSQIYSFRVHKNMTVWLFKEKIANEIGVPVGQQRLIFRGRVLKDEHPLSEYQVENGHTLHLVTRQPSQQQPSADTSFGETNANNANQGNDAGSGVPQNRVGQISHSVVLGTFNVGDQGEGTVPDVSRVIGAVLNSFGIGGQSVINSTGGQSVTNSIGGLQSSILSNVFGQTPQVNETGGSLGNVGGQSQAGNQTQYGQPVSSPQVLQIPLAAAVPVPSLHSPIPDSLSTLSEFMTRMEQALEQNGYLPNTASSSTGELPMMELPSNARGLPTPEALSIVLRHAERLLSGHTSSALSHIAERMQHEGGSADPTLRGQIQTESMQVGRAMHNLGALLLELGRTILTLRMGQSPAESSLNPGPAVYISPSGPNPIMVQPFPLQANAFFDGSVPSTNPVTTGAVGVGNAQRQINIHIHAGTSLAPVTIGTRGTSGEGLQGEHGNGTGSSGPGPARVLPLRNVLAAALPSRAPGVATSNTAQSGVGVTFSQPPSESVSISSAVAELSSQLRNIVSGVQGESQSVSGNDVGNEQPNAMANDGAREPSVSLPGVMSESDDQKVQVSNNVTKALEDASSCSVGGSSGETSQKAEKASEGDPSSSENLDLQGVAKTVPLGLGLGGLERKSRIRQPKSLAKSAESGTSDTSLNQNLNGGINNQQFLHSLASPSTGTNRTSASSTPSVPIPPFVGRVPESRPLGEQASDGQFNAGSVMSEVLHSPALNGLLAGVSEQTGFGSPNVLRNMLQQLTQNPQIMGTVSQIAQQVDSQDLGNMFSVVGSGQGGGIDLSRMVQQMMPVVSQVLGQGSATAQPFPTMEPEQSRQCDEGRSSGAQRPNDQDIQMNLQEVTDRIDHNDAPGDVFRAVVENTVRLVGNGSSLEGIVHELSSNDDLASEYMDMLRRDVCHRLQGDSGQDNC